MRRTPTKWSISVGTDWVEDLTPLIPVCCEVSHTAAPWRVSETEKLYFSEELTRKMMTTPSYNPLKRQQDLQTLTNIIVSWNSTRLDLFELTLPNEDLEFSGKYYKKYKIGKGRKLNVFYLQVWWGFITSINSLSRIRKSPQSVLGSRAETQRFKWWSLWWRNSGSEDDLLISSLNIPRPDLIWRCWRSRSTLSLRSTSSGREGWGWTRSLC